MYYRWSATTKRVLGAAGLVVLALVVYAARPVLPVLFAAGVLVYLLLPLVGALERRGLRHRLAAALVFLLLVALLLALPLLGLPALVRSARALDLPEVQAATGDVIRDVLERVRVLNLGGAPLDLSAVVDPLEARVADLASRPLPQLITLMPAGQGARDVFRLLGFVGTFLLTLVTTLYVLLDLPRLSTGLWSLVPEGQRLELEVLAGRLHRIWGAYFRGQLLLVVLVSAAIALGGLALGLPGALWLGLVAGVLEVVPYVGPVLAAAPGVAVALVRGSTWLPVPHEAFALVVLGLYVVVRTAEDNLVIPHVIGHAVGLPPVVVLLGTIVGAEAGGVIGLLLAAPIIASLLVLGRYWYNKLRDLPPFEDEPVYVRKDGDAPGPPGAG